jgi:hypothetical protein
MNTENTINMSNIENIKICDDVKINIIQKKNEGLDNEDSEMIEEEQDVCCICLDNMSGDKYTYIICKHAIHEGCYIEYAVFNGAELCPLCRTRDLKKNTIINEQSNQDNTRIINIINIRISQVRPEGIYRLNNIFTCNRLGTLIVIGWALLLLLISIFVIRPINK